MTLHGPILASEVQQFVAGIESVRGVTRVENQLEVVSEPGDVPGLQGGIPRPGERPEYLQNNWSPTARLLVGVAGGVLVLYGLRKGGAKGTSLSATGINLITEGISHPGR